MTPAVFAHLVAEMFDAGRVFSRADLTAQVADEHERRGGLPARGSVTAVAKKALQNLLAAGRVESVSQGFWRIAVSDDPDQAPDADGQPIEVGEGTESVYVYYFPAYRDQAAHLGRSDWPMKIGMTAGEVAPRLRDQCGTAMPERPVVGMIYRTDSSRVAERLLHSSLETRGRRMTDAPGKEWFMTSLAEVKEILDFTNGR